MKVLLVTTSRADWNGLGMVVRELIKRQISCCVAAVSNAPDWADAIIEDVKWYDFGNGVLERACTEYMPNVAVVAGDRSELLEACVTLCKYKIPICHIGGGCITQGSMDDRYRDAITALSTIHCVETARAFDRMVLLTRGDRDMLTVTGMPGLDRIRITEPKAGPSEGMMSPDRPNVLLLVHPNTVLADPMLECDAICLALKQMDVNVLPMEANRDCGGECINHRLVGCFGKLISNAPPAEFYWLLQHCDVLVGNSSAGTAEAPCFGIPVVNVGDRQKGRSFYQGVIQAQPDPEVIKVCVRMALSGRFANWLSPYGDGHAAENIVDALEKWFCWQVPSAK